MMKSMTGFSSRAIAAAGIQGTIGLKSYNNRYLDLSVSLPPYLQALEPRVREYLSARIVHGKVEFWLRIRELDLPVRASADLEAAKAVYEVLRQVSDACGMADAPRLGNVLAFDGVVAYEREIDRDAAWARLEPDLAACFSDFDESRLREGAATWTDIEAQLARVSSAVDAVRSRLPEIERTVRNQLLSRFKEVLGDAVDESRVLAETASMLMKYTVNEEIARLTAHIASFARIAEKDAAPGKKLDFLCQEMNREVNTIGSKNILLPVSEAVVELKDALENVREQLRNIE